MFFVLQSAGYVAFTLPVRVTVPSGVATSIHFA
jgi:hypothetical protein